MQHEGKQVTGLKQTSADFGLSFFQILVPSFFGKTNLKKKKKKSSSEVQKL